MGFLDMVSNWRRARQTDGRCTWASRRFSVCGILNRNYFQSDPRPTEFLT
jgi:hypothetical protein